MAENQQSLVELIRDFMTKEVKPHVLERGKEGHYPEEIIQMGIDMGLHMMQVSEEYGGMGLDATTTAMMIGEGAKMENTCMGMFNVTSMGSKIVMAARNEEQGQYYAGLLNKGSVNALYPTEPGVGSGNAVVRTTAVCRGSSYVTNGTKMFITNVSLANMFLAVASVGPSKGSRGLATFIVERDRRGVNISKKTDKLGMRLSNTVGVILEDVEIPVCNLVGAKESEFAGAIKVPTAPRPMIAASSLGVCQLARDLVVQYSRGRVASGKPICTKQMIQEKLADMEMLTQTSHGLVYHTATFLDQGRLYNTEASVAKCFVTEAFERIIDQALQTFGSCGLHDEHLVSELYRDARANRIVEGINEIQRVVTSKAMLRQS